MKTAPTILLLSRLLFQFSIKLQCFLLAETKFDRKVCIIGSILSFCSLDSNFPYFAYFSFCSVREIRSRNIMVYHTSKIFVYNIDRKFNKFWLYSIRPCCFVSIERLIYLIYIFRSWSKSKLIESGKTFSFMVLILRWFS